jgi:hypothetical protein
MRSRLSRAPVGTELAARKVCRAIATTTGDGRKVRQPKAETDGEFVDADADAQADHGGAGSIGGRCGLLST